MLRTPVKLNKDEMRRLSVYSGLSASPVRLSRAFTNHILFLTQALTMTMTTTTTPTGKTQWIPLHLLGTMRLSIHTSPKSFKNMIRRCANASIRRSRTGHKRFNLRPLRVTRRRQERLCRNPTFALFVQSYARPLHLPLSRRYLTYVHPISPLRSSSFPWVGMAIEILKLLLLPVPHLDKRCRISRHLERDSRHAPSSCREINRIHPSMLLPASQFNRKAKKYQATRRLPHDKKLELLGFKPAVALFH
ncbi:hypothetical protein M378DRAFT_539078 [Amanita muscaria Koide BX008]|uniref:Uncharacterized protein n=1 Tax=Amanita muscaria (strain Koide BX008) TaxID=946122 RepID=A0A0C2TET5_AMAMK|nr:hypothetical protein M378DRAFT_539078 [Amanita muscaria Koide BX008]